MKQLIRIVLLLFVTTTSVQFSFAGSPSSALKMEIGQPIAQKKAIEKPKMTVQNIVKGQIEKVKHAFILSETPKNKWIALVLLWFLGIYGAHFFYLGYKNKGMKRLILTLAVQVGLIAGILMLYAAFFSIFFIASEALLISLIAIGGVLFLGGFVLGTWLDIALIIELVKILSDDLLPADGSEYDE